MTVEEIEELILIISDKLDDKLAADKAFTKLYKGYSRFLFSVVSSVLKSMGIYDEQVLATVINNTFFIIYEKPLAFAFPTDAADDKSFKAWLSTVAKNELKRLLNEYHGKTSSLELVKEELVLESEDLGTDIFESVNLKTMNDALETLSVRDKEILMTLYLYYEEGKNTPSEVLDLLCKVHDTTKENIRQIKKRSEKKIVEYFSNYSQLKPLKDVR
jgi:RNA polymerase sigma factor (sigma-70 family)